MTQPVVSCSTCPYRHDLGVRGLQCRYRAPTAEPITNLAAWPHVKAGDYCADHPDFEPAREEDSVPGQTPRLL